MWGVKSVAALSLVEATTTQQRRLRPSQNNVSNSGPCVPDDGPPSAETPSNYRAKAGVHVPALACGGDDKPNKQKLSITATSAFTHPTFSWEPLSFIKVHVLNGSLELNSEVQKFRVSGWQETTWNHLWGHGWCVVVPSRVKEKLYARFTLNRLCATQEVLSWFPLWSQKINSCLIRACYTYKEPGSVQPRLTRTRRSNWVWVSHFQTRKSVVRMFHGRLLL